MGSSGESYNLPSSSSNEGLAKLISQANKGANASAYASEVNSLIREALATYNKRDVLAIQTHIKVLIEAIQREIEGAVKLIFGGSIRKYTYVNGLSDIDGLVLIQKTSLEKSSPQEVLDYFANQIQQRLPKTEVSVGKLAVTVRYSDGCELQLLPAIRTRTGFKIASSLSEGQWSNVVRPEAFARKLTSVNQSFSGKVVPVIKLFKVAVKEVFPKDLKLSGYHAESLAIEAFEKYTESNSYKDMLIHLSRTATDLVKTPIKDRTGQSLHVDDYLGVQNSKQRLRLCSYLRRLAQQMEVADEQQSIETWQEWFDNE